jgi:predicted nucleic acid-binding protein
VIAYIDSSIVLRLALGQPNVLREWRQIERGVSSALAGTECLRALDRLRLRAPLSDSDVAARRSTILSLIASIDELVSVDEAVLRRAGEPMPTSMGTLDAVHLATALLWKESESADLVMATHDAALALAARAHGMPVVGV